MRSFFYFGVMKASKSAQLVLKANTYKVQGVEPIIVKPSTDTRETENIVHSRIGISIDVDYVVKPYDVLSMLMILDQANEEDRPIFIDECQFFTKGVIKRFLEYAHKTKNEGKSNFNIYLYGLLKTYDNELFDGSKVVLENVDDIIEIDTICEEDGCDNKATCNFLNGNHSSSDKVVIGDNQYSVYCEEHYLSHVLEVNKNVQ